MSTKNQQKSQTQTNKNTQISNLALIFSLLLCPLMVGIDFLGIGIILKPIKNTFNVDLDTVHWIISIFAIGYVSVTILGSKLSDKFGRRKVFTSTLLLLLISSMFCGLAPASFFIILLLGRFLQGVSAGVMIIVVITIITETFEGENRKKWIGFIYAATGVGFAAGPILAGIFVDFLSWRAFFLINIPISLLSIGFYLSNFPRDKVCKQVKFDIIGVLLLTIALASFAAVISEVKDWGVLGKKSIILHCVWIISLVLLYIVEKSQKEPILNTRFFSTKNYAIACFIGTILYFSLIGWIIISSLYFTSHYKFSALQTGLTFVPYGIANLLSVYILNKYTKNIKNKSLITIGVLSNILCFILMTATLYFNLNFYFLIISSIFLSIGTTFPNTMLNVVGVEYFNKKDLSLGVGMLQTFRWIGSALGAPVMASILIYFVNSKKYNFNWNQSLSICYSLLAILFILILILSSIFIKEKTN